MTASEVRADHVQAELLSDVSAIQPGKPFWLGVHLTVDPGWHVYWKNPGDAGLPVPGFFSFRLDKRVEKILPRVQFPCVVKPLRLAASQGVIRANQPEEFQTAVARIKDLLESPEVKVTQEPELDRLLVERYIPGAEVAVEGLLTRGKLRILGVFDKPDPLEGPYFEETLYVTPSRLPDEI